MNLPTIEEIARAVYDASQETERLEQRAIALLHERGSMAGLSCDQQRQIEEYVRDQIEANY